jgi:hypothetical protein
MEFFAELSVAYHWGRDKTTEYNGWFPYNKHQLGKLDPTSFLLLRKYWSLYDPCSLILRNSARFANDSWLEIKSFDNIAVDEDARITLTLTNNTNHEVGIAWINSDGYLVPHSSIKQSKNIIASYPGHSFVLFLKEVPSLEAVSSSVSYPQRISDISREALLLCCTPMSAHKNHFININLSHNRRMVDHSDGEFNIIDAFSVAYSFSMT